MAHNRVEVFRNLNRLANWIFKGEEFFRNLLANHADINRWLVVLILNEPPFVQLQLVELLIFGGATDQATFDGFIISTELHSILSDLHGLSDGVTEIIDDASIVRTKQAILHEKSTACRTALLSRLNRSHDNVCRTQPLNLLFGLLGNALTHGHEPDDRHNSNQNTQNGQA